MVPKPYKICDEEMEHMYTEKYIQLISDENSTFEEHISNKVRIANTRL